MGGFATVHGAKRTADSVEVAIKITRDAVVPMGVNTDASRSKLSGSVAGAGPGVNALAAEVFWAEVRASIARCDCDAIAAREGG